MNLVEFLQDLSVKGVKFWIEGERLRTGGSQEVLTVDVITQLKKYKAQILQLLLEQPDVLSVYPLSYGQRALWFLWQLEPESHAYNVSFAGRIGSEVDITAMQRAFETLIERHPILRTNYPKLGSEPIQKIHNFQRLDFKQIDAQSWSEEQLKAKVIEAHQQPFDLEREPVMRVRWFTRFKQEHVLLLSIHHIACDVWSIDILIEELSKLYRAQLLGLNPSLPPVKHSYQNYVNWQRKILCETQGEKLWSYWQQKLHGNLPALNLPTDKQRPPIQTYNGASIKFKLSSKLVSQLKELARRERVTFYVTLLAAFKVLLYRYTGQEDIMVGSPTSGRSQPEFAPIVGYFVDPVVMRADLSNNPSFKDFLSQVRQTVLEALTHQDYPFALLVEKLQPHRDPSRSPIFQASFALQQLQKSQDIQRSFVDEIEKNIDWGGLKLKYEEIPLFEGQFDLTLEMTEGSSEVAGIFKYNTDLFDAETIERMVCHFQNLLDSIVENPLTPVGKLTLLSESERHQLLVEWNDTATVYPQDKCIHQLFEEQVEKTPDAIAVVFEQEKLTYKQLNQRANQLAHHLQSLGVKPEILVGICVERSIEMVVGLLGILKAGGAYVPLDPNYPPERLSYMLEDSGVEVLVTQSQLLESLPENNARLVRLDSDWGVIEQQSQDNLDVGVGSENLAYVIYTSGSTGKPKGAMNTHQGIRNRLLWMQDTYQLNSSDRVLQKTPFSFDVSVWEFFWPLLTGARIVVAKPEGHKDTTYLANLIDSEQITTIHFVSSMLQVFLQSADKENCNCLKRVFCSGEALPFEFTQLFFSKFECQLHNLYGPTEAAIDVTFWQCKPQSNLQILPIGRPIANTQIYILDSHLQPLPVGVPGELYIGGDGLARGYLNRPQLTQEKFIQNPFNNSKSQRLYKTGDLARYLRDGNITFMGRIDNQVKIRGFRIELGEVEAVINKHPSIRESVVIIQQNKSDKKGLAAYLIPDEKQAAPVLQLIRLQEQGSLLNKSLYELPNGFTITYLNKNETDFIYQEIFEQESYLRHGITINDGDCIFDVGANIGLFSLFAAKTCCNLEVYAFEPIPPVFELLRLNTEIHSLNVKLFDVGLAAETKQDTFTYYPHVSLISGRFADALEEQKIVTSFLLNQDSIDETELSPVAIKQLLTERLKSEQFTCQLKTISEVIEENNVKQIDLLKIDVEKSELEVLKGIKQEDWQKINQIVVEVHNLDGRLAEITQLLEVHGYKFIVDQETELRETEIYNIYAIRKSFERVSRKIQKVVSDQKPSWNSKNAFIKDIRHHLKAELPEFMIPYSFVILDRLPLTPNGKIDRFALPTPEIERETAYTAPRTEVEQILTNIWQEFLPVNSVSIHDNFFEIGGDSILSIQVISRAKNAGILLSAKQIFQHQTIAELATVAITTVSYNCQQGIVTGTAPLTPIQHRFFEEQTEELHHYNQSVLLQIPNNIKLELLENVLEELIEHHDALRLRFTQIASEYKQTNQGVENKVPLTVIDLSETPREEQPQSIERIATEYQASLNLSTGPIIQMVMFNLGKEIDGRLLIIIHHLAVDGVSWRILLADLETIYHQLINEQPIQLSPKTTAFIDWATKLNNYAQSEIIQKELDYWVNQPWSNTASLPLDYVENQQKNTVSSAVDISVKLNYESTSILLGSINDAYNTQINDILLSALSIALAQWTGDSKVLIDLEGHGREEIFDDVDLSSTVGWFTSVFPVLLQAPSDNNIASVIKSIKEQLRAIPNRGIGFGILRHLSNPEITEQIKSITTPDIAFNYLGQFDQIQSETGWKFATEPTGNNHSLKHIRSHLLDVNALVVNGELQITWTYSSNIYSHNTIEKLAENYLQAIQSIIEHCQLESNKGYTPSDFPLAQLNQLEIDELLTPEAQISTIYPLSPMQQGMLFHSLYAPESGVYFEQMTMDLTGNIDVTAFEAAWQKVVDRYSILRTFFVLENRQTPLQIVLKQVLLPWQNLDWRELDCQEQEQQLEQLLQTQREQGFDFNQAPLMNCILVRLGDNNYKFIWSHHHILMDGWCLPIIFKDVLGFYEAQIQGVSYQLPKPRPYSDYIAWLNSQDKSAAIDFWQQYLQGFTAPTPLVVDKTISQSKHNSKDYHEIDCVLSAEKSQKLAAIAQQNRCTLSTIVQAAWSLLLSRYSDDDDVVFGVTVSGRPTISGVEDMVGLFINTLPLRIKVHSEEQLISWLQEIQESMVKLQQYSYTPLVDIQANSQVNGGTPLFESIVVFENYPIDSSLLNQEYSLQLSNIEGFEKTNYPLTVVAVPGDELSIKISYDTARFAQDTIERMLAHLQNILDSIVENPLQKVGNLSLMSDWERHQLLVEWNDTAYYYPQDKCIHELFEEQVEKTPDAIAVVFEQEQLTYQQLNQRANQLAHHLQSLGVKPEVLVGICVEPSIEMVVGLLGILKAGGTYVPLDPNYPQERLSYMLEDSGVGVLVTQSQLLESVPENNARLVCLDSDWGAIEQQSQGNLDIGVNSANLAYVIYTSGSTGKPKGVLVDHYALVNHCLNIQSIYQLVPSDRVLQFSSLSFDPSLEQIFVPLTIGAGVVVRGEKLWDANQFKENIEKYSITVVNLPPAYWQQLVQQWLNCPQLAPKDKPRLIIIGGDAMPPETVQFWQKTSLASARLLNAYGPTETTITSTVFEVNYAADFKKLPKNIPIGRPIANTQIYILDSHLQPVPVGVPGELYIGGDGLARGYLNRPQLTSEKFILNPFDNSQRLYKTGDQARFLPDGNIEFLGRIDNQVKIRGFRIELGEIEAVLATHPQVNQAVVIAIEENTGSKRLVAYVVTNSEITTQQLREYLNTQLPGYMIPSVFVTLDSLPLTPNGKVDRKALPAPDINLTRSHEYVPPQTETEKQITAVLQEVLQLEKVSIYDNFFELGANSLTLLTINSKLRGTLSVKLPVTDMFTYPNIKTLSQHIAKIHTPKPLQKKVLSPSQIKSSMKKRRQLRQQR